MKEILKSKVMITFGIVILVIINIFCWAQKNADEYYKPIDVYVVRNQK